MANILSGLDENSCIDSSMFLSWPLHQVADLPDQTKRNSHCILFPFSLYHSLTVVSQLNTDCFHHHTSQCLLKPYKFILHWCVCFSCNSPYFKLSLMLTDNLTGLHGSSYVPSTARMKLSTVALTVIWIIISKRYSGKRTITVVTSDYVVRCSDRQFLSGGIWLLQARMDYVTSTKRPKRCH